MPDIDETLPATAAPGAETKRFAPQELLTCEACLRANAPTRTRCIYCGAELRPTASGVPSQPEFQATPRDANRIYIVARLRAGQSIANAVVDQLAASFQLKPAELQAAISAAAVFPLTIAAREEARRLFSELQEYGLETFSIQETDLQTLLAARKIRALEFTGTTISAWTTSPVQQVRAAWSDLALIVSGRLHTSRVEVDERPSRASTKYLDRRELTQDESVVDLYAKSGETWRIGVTDFDFSCLGERKSLTAVVNLRVLMQLLICRSGAELNDAYARIRPLLAELWPLEIISSKSRSRQPRAGRKDVSTVTVTDNIAQFNNYSRLAWSVKLHELENRQS